MSSVDPHSIPNRKSKPVARSLSRLIDATGEVVWLLDAAHRIVWMSDACETWLGVSDASLVGIIAAASHATDDKRTAIAASLAPPFGLREIGCIDVDISPPQSPARHVRFVQVGLESSAVIIATCGPVLPCRPPEAEDLVALQTSLHRWRKRDSTWGGIAAAGSSRDAKRLRRQIQLASITRQSFSIVGPPGCGAEWIVRRIHVLETNRGQPSVRGNVPLIAIDGPLMDAELLEASLSPVAALLGGDTETPRVTIVVRGLDDTPLDVQHQIEQFVAERNDSVRLVGLLNQSPEDAISAAKLSTPLASRIDALVLTITPLASRVEDIALIASAIVDSRHAGGHGPAERLNRAALDQLMLYPWPQNFDELDSSMRHAMSSCRGSAIGPEHLPLAIRSYRPGEPTGEQELVVSDLDAAMRRYELKMIESAVRAADGNRSDAARRLGISRARLLRRLDDADGAQP